ncbi:hypothetical protein DSL72_000817 [Monilinia vaccinii-corymbosi]|uniref:Dihydroneopterin aldolase/epimerase domain-containing protein n=1 Tax=Monilinia vaccinii-corymbosi TaxID=61207 RepID=A0A8A3P501_9HELO|nr:hypothetical protein DSL72_000817 [Monilinia vaccinii-corymbosi]
MDSQVDPSHPSAAPSENYPPISNMTTMSRWELLKAREEPVAVIEIKDLQVEAFIGADAWGWDWDVKNCQSQPILVSMSLSLRQPFSTASEKDDLTEDTIHYGRLRSGIIESVSNFNSPQFNPMSPMYFCPGVLILHIAEYFSQVARLTTGKYINWSSYKVMLPKSSLFGAGISLTVETLYNAPSLKNKNGAWGAACTLRVHDLTVPIIIGMLDKERVRKQNVVANVEIDRYQSIGDLHWDIEQMILRTMEESSFQTLEALAEQIGKRVTRHILIPNLIAKVRSESAKANNKWESYSDDYKMVPWKKTEIINLCSTIKIKLEKPGIYIDTTPGVEMTMDIRPLPNSPYFSLWKGYKRLSTPKRPFEGSLNEWIAKNSPEGMTEGDSTMLDLAQQMEAFQASLAESRRFTSEVISRPSSSSKSIPGGLKNEESGLADLQRKMESFQAGFAQSKKNTDEINAQAQSSHSKP